MSNHTEESDAITQKLNEEYIQQKKPWPITGKNINLFHLGASTTLSFYVIIIAGPLYETSSFSHQRPLIKGRLTRQVLHLTQAFHEMTLDKFKLPSHVQSKQIKQDTDTEYERPEDDARKFTSIFKRSQNRRTAKQFIEPCFSHRTHRSYLITSSKEEWFARAEKIRRPGTVRDHAFGKIDIHTIHVHTPR
ncbi:hypothetical protein BJ508DRAFT_309721 [Ascobolus immersus RN42]|uniref:Uncharacterized protein n=1 Tax=Ascobolus immersus RN42 TaxID=1160509 RepID=A0A3N4I0Y4_ASCIM|nr:hypothetical protein BJ508DRAFT_309721 [Ascobolus immersus RN42]